MNGMHADGSKATGFKSMVVAQFTGLSLQKDDRAFVRYNASTGNYDVATAGDGAHLDGFAEYRKGWGHEHIKCSNDSFIQAVSVFAVGYAGHFIALSGGDMSITNSNSNFGNTALRSAGFKAKAFSKDKAGALTHIIPPKSLSVISTTATGSNGASAITLTNDGSINGVIEGMTVSGDGIGSGATVGSVNTNTRVVTLTASNTSAVNGNVIFGEQTSVNWVNIDIQRTKTINSALAGQGGTPGTRLYLYGYTVEASPPTTKVQGYTVGARQDGTGVNAVPDKLNCLLVANGATEATTQTAKISPYGPSVSGKAAGATGSPIQYDSSTYTIGGVAGQVGGWYLSVDSVDNEIYTTLSTNTQYNTVNFTPTTFIKRIADGRDLQDRTYRVRYVIDKDKTNPLPRDPISGYVMQPLNTDTTSYKLNKTFYIYDIEVVQEFERGVNDGIYYLTLLCASIAPSTSNFNDRKFSQNVNEVYPTFDRDNPVADPDAAVSVADNETIGLVNATDGATPTPAKDPKRSITKEAVEFLLTDTGWTQPGTTPNYDSVNERLSNVELTARSGEEETRKINIRQNNDGSVAPINVEFRRHSILRSGNHTFEYLGFGPGNYSTAFPQTQVETLSADQIKFSQSIKEEAGVAFYSGLNSNGDLFIGNQVINPVTGQITNEDIAQLNVVGEENTTIQTFSELVLTDKLTVIGGASNQLESIFAGPVTFQGQTSFTNNITAKKITYNNQDGTVIKQTLLAPADANGQPSFANITGYDTPGDGDLVYNINWTPGKSLGWIYYNGAWKEFGLTDTGDINIDTFNNEQHIGIGTAAVSGFRVGIDGNAKVDGDLVVTGRGGVGADKYITKSYTGDGSTLTFAVSTYSGGIQHSDDSLLVFLNGVAQIAGTNYTVDSNGANVVFSSGDAPLASDTVHILELPI